jgi:alginate O-acetyltransferase complex protein AlgI
VSIVSPEYIGFLLLAAMTYRLARAYFGRRGLLAFLLLLNAMFAAFSGPQSVIALTLSMAFNYFIITQIRRTNGLKRLESLLILGVGVDVLLIFLPKALKVSGSPIFFLGTSYYSIQQIMVLVDLYQAKTMSNKEPNFPCQSFLGYCSFVSFFGQLTAGPISTWKQTGRSLSEPASPSQLDAFRGSLIFARGLFQKLVISGVFTQFSSALFASQAPNARESAVGLVLGYLSLYFDFSGYTDMAIGTGLLFGVHLPLNFNQPLNAVSLSEFWSKWHVTLTGFIKNYIYFPFVRSYGGNSGRAKLSLVFSMGLVGIWHDLTLRYLLFGLLHGLGMIALPWQSPAKGKKWQQRWSWLFTQAYVVFTMAFFLSPNLGVTRVVLSSFMTSSRPSGQVFAGIEVVDKGLCLLALAYTFAHVRGNMNTLQELGKAEPGWRLWFWFVSVSFASLLFLNAGIPKNFVYADF